MQLELRIGLASVSVQLAVKLGRALRPGEYKLSVYQLLIHEVEVRDSSNLVYNFLLASALCKDHA